MTNSRAVYAIGAVGLAVFLAVVSPLVEDIDPKILTGVIVISLAAVGYGGWRFATDLWERRRDRRLPPGDDIGLLQTYVNAENKNEDLDEVGKQFADRHGWDLEAHGRAVERLLDDRLVRAQVVRVGSNAVGALMVRGVTAEGRRRASGMHA